MGVDGRRRVERPTNPARRQVGRLERAVRDRHPRGRPSHESRSTDSAPSVRARSSAHTGNVSLASVSGGRRRSTSCDVPPSRRTRLNRLHGIEALTATLTRRKSSASTTVSDRFAAPTRSRLPGGRPSMRSKLSKRWDGRNGSVTTTTTLSGPTASAHRRTSPP